MSSMTQDITPETAKTREGITFMQAARMFSTEAKAEAWFIQKRWGSRANITCPKCGEASVCEIKSRNPLPFQCTKPECRKCFSVKTGSVMQSSKLPLTHWAIAYYLITTNLKGISSCKLARELGITQKSAWHMLNRIRQSWDDNSDRFHGPVEVDEMYHGGAVKNRPISKRQRIGGGPKGKAVVLGMKDRFSDRILAMHVPDQRGTTIRPIVAAHTEPDAKVYTDDSIIYNGLQRSRESVNHSG